MKESTAQTDNNGFSFITPGVYLSYILICLRIDLCCVYDIVLTFLRDSPWRRISLLTVSAYFHPAQEPFSSCLHPDMTLEAFSTVC